MITAVPRVAIAVRDMDRAIATFRDVFGMPVHEFEWLPEALGIRMALSAPPRGAPIELMAPFDPSHGHSRSLIRYLERRGEGLFALMLYAPDPDAEAEELAGRGLEVMPLMPEAHGRDIHPRNTAGVLIRIYPSGSDADLERELEQALGPASGRDSRAHLSGITRVLVAVRDLDAAAAIYRDRLGLETELHDPSEASGVRSAVCTPRSGARVELLSPLQTDSPTGREIAGFLAERGEGLYALVLESDDLDATRSALEAKGVGLRPIRDGRGGFEIPPEAAFGARIRLEARTAQFT